MEIHDVELYHPKSSVYWYKEDSDVHIRFKIRPLRTEFTATFEQKQNDYELRFITYHNPGKGGSYADDLLDYGDEEFTREVKNLIHHPKIRIKRIMEIY